MKITLWRMICLCLSIMVRAVAEEQEPASEPVPASEPAPRRSAEELEQIFGAIALYPDALVALILPASTVPSDVVLASRFLKVNADIGKAENELWADSVKALLHYPDVINWMDQNLAWTKQAGEAFLDQPAEVMSSIQSLRFKALAAGTLVNTAQQQVIVEGNTIRIIPAQTNVIYVPVYDPAVVYVPQYGYYSYPFLTFGVGWATGYWLAYDCDWGHRRIWTVDSHYREKYWHDHADWRRPNYPGRAEYGDGNYHHQAWRPPLNSSRPSSYAGNHSRPNGDSTNHSSGNTSRNRPPGSDVQANGVNSSPGKHGDRSSADSRDSHWNQHPANPPAPTTPDFTPPQPNRVPRPASTGNDPQTPQRPPQNNHDRSERAKSTNDGTKNAGNSPAPSPSRPAQIAADRPDSIVRGRERATPPVSPPPQQNRVAPPSPPPSAPPPPPSRTYDSNGGQSRSHEQAPPRVQAVSSDQSSDSARGNQNHRADRVQSD